MSKARNLSKLKPDSSGLIESDDLTSAITINTLSVGQANFADNAKAIFGAGSDLQIYHTGSHSYIDDVGTGQLRIRATNLEITNSSGTQNMIVATDGGSVSLRYAGGSKLATTSTGVDVTGTVEATAFVGDGSGLTGVGGVTSVNGQTGDVTVSVPAAFPAGTTMLFAQTSAPTGWTKSTTHDNKALRLVSGTAGSGGSAAFTTAFGTPSVGGSISGTVGNTTLSTSQIPSHSHTIPASKDWNNGGYNVVQWSTSGMYGVSGNATDATGGGGSHTHSFSGSLSSATATINVAYVDVILATKD